MSFFIGDYVTRKSYNNDIVFKIVSIHNNVAYLKGVNVRLFATSFLSDLKIDDDKRSVEDEIYLPIRKNDYLNGKVLHIDGDIEYLKRSMKLYEKYNVPAIGYKIDEKLMPSRIKELLNETHPDILIITGHDAIDKDGRNVNSRYFIECVRQARMYQPSKDALCIIAGACYSSFKELINEGSNISSSPGKVSINVLDPAKVAIMIATTSVTEYVDIRKVISMTSNKEKGMGGIETKGVARKIY